VICGFAPSNKLNNQIAHNNVSVH